MEQAANYGMQVQELFFRYGFFFLFGVSVFLTPVRQVKPVYFGIFCLLILVSSLFGFDINSRRAVLNIFIGFLFYKMLLDHFNFEYLKHFSKFSLGVVIANLLMCLMQYFGHDPLFSTPENMGPLDRVGGFMKLKVHLGVLASFLAPFLFLLNPFLVILCLPLLAFGVSSAAVSAFAISMVMLVWFKYGKKIAIPLCILIIVSGVFYVLKYDMPGGQFGERFKVWHIALSYTLKGNLFFGLGLGSFAKLEPFTSQLTTTEKLSWIWAHNEYLQLLFEGGIASLVVVILYLRDSFKKFISCSRDNYLGVLFASFVAVCLISFLHFPFHLGRFAPLCLFIMAVFHGRRADVS